MSMTDFPCADCGALPGEPCGDDCPVANMSFEEFEAMADEFDIATGALLPPDEQPRTMEDSLSLLATHVHRLPFSSMVGVRGMGAPDRQDFSPEEYISRLADWMAEYEPILRAMVDDLHDQSRQRIALQFEKDVVRGFFGKVSQ